MEGEIVKILSDTHFVKIKEETIPCKCRGKFRNQGIVPLVGDVVKVDLEQQVIEEILPRRNEFVRPAVSNIDQAFLVTSVKHPDFSLNLLDKLLLVMELHHVRPIICLTKEDLLSKQEKKMIQKQISYYKKIGYSVVSNKKIRKIKKLLKGKTSVFTGQTGAGKSTLLNRLNKELLLETGEISLALGRGKHTTRHVELISMFGGRVLDTPGFSSLDFEGYTKAQVRDGFVEFRNYACLYQDCFHLHENMSECKVKQAVEHDEILKTRYDTYSKIMKQVR